MDRNLRFFIISLSLVLCFGCEKANQTYVDNTKGIDLKNNLETLKSTIDDLNEAIIEKNAKALEKICSQELSYGHSSGAIQNKNEFILDVVKGPFSFVAIESENESIKFIGDLGIVRSIFVAEGLNNGEQAALRIGIVQVFQYDSTHEWKLLLRQGFKL